MGRPAASELERRWNEKLEAIAETKHRLSELDEMRYALSNEEEAQIRAMGENFSAVWESDLCPTELKKMIFRTVIEEIIVRTDAAKTTLQFTIHWKGGVHTQIEMQRPRGATDCATPMEALDIVDGGRSGESFWHRWGSDQSADSSARDWCGGALPRS